MKKLYIFDLDGTLLDTLEDLYLSVNRALREYGLPERSKDEVHDFIGDGIRMLINRSVPRETDEKTVEKVFSFFKEYYEKHCEDNTRPYDGIIEVLQKIRARGAATAVVSNKADFAVKKLVSRYFPNLFDVIIGQSDNVRRKPYPDSVNAVLAALGVDKKDAFFIGDSEVDVQTAFNAAVDCIAVTWGYRSVTTLKTHGATRFAHAPRDLLTRESV